MNALWIADSHLSDPGEPSYEALRTLLNRCMETMDSLVILGDLFELWVGDNQILLSQHESMLDIFYKIRAKGKSIYYLKGNHDFILGKTFEDQIGAEIYEEEAIIEWDGYRFFASHGENIDKKDHGYRVLRKILRNPLTEKAVYALDDRIIHRLGKQVGTLTKGRPNEENLRNLQALYLDYAKEHMRNNCHAVILAHSHRIQWVVVPVDGKKRLYINPGSWSDENTFLWYQKGRFQLKKYGESGDEILFDFVLSVD